MDIDIYTVIAIPEGFNGEYVEISEHYKLEKAREVAQRYSQKHRVPTTIDCNTVRISRKGKECIDSLCGVWGAFNENGEPA